MFRPLDKLRRTLFDRADERVLFTCGGCGRSFEVQRQVCPECGGYNFTRTNWDSS
ncbi:hypothetical protein [Haladaptatus sp. NG-WS-4]